MKKILIVEDDKNYQRILTEKLTLEGFDIKVAENGEEGLIAIREYAPDLILLDIIMPKMDGITMLKSLAVSDPKMAERIMVLTNLSDNKTISQAIENGSYSFLIKSNWSVADLVKKIREKLSA